jgi:hypothetical protein
VRGNAGVIGTTVYGGHGAKIRKALRDRTAQPSERVAKRLARPVDMKRQDPRFARSKTEAIDFY